MTPQEEEEEGVSETTRVPALMLLATGLHQRLVLPPDDAGGTSICEAAQVFVPKLSRNVP